MSLARKVIELSHGRVLTNEINAHDVGRYNDWKNVLEASLKKIREYNGEVQMNISRGDYIFEALNHKHPDTSTDFWLQKLNEDRKMSFINQNSGIFIPAVINGLSMYLRAGICEVNFTHQIYSNVTTQSHYLDLRVTSELNYHAGYPVNFHSISIKTDVFANWIANNSEKQER